MRTLKMRCDWRKVEQDHNQDCLEIKRSVLVLVLVLCFLFILSLLPVFLRSFPSPVFPPPAARPLVRFVCIQAVVLHSVFVSSFLRWSRFSSSCFFFLFLVFLPVCALLCFATFGINALCFLDLAACFLFLVLRHLFLQSSLQKVKTPNLTKQNKLCTSSWRNFCKHTKNLLCGLY